MFKVMGILKRPEGKDFEEFKKWWLTEHSLKVKQWPGLVEYRINMSTTPDQDYDGVAEVWFESREAMEAVFSTPEGERARASATAGAAASGLSILLTEEHVMSNSRHTSTTNDHQNQACGVHHRNAARSH